MGFWWCSQGPFVLIPIRSSLLLAPSLPIAMTVAALFLQSFVGCCSLDTGQMYDAVELITR